MVYGAPNVTTMVGLSQYVSTVTGGVFWSLMLFVMFIITFAVMSHSGIGQALPGATFITTIIAILLRSADILPSNTEVFICIIASFASALWSYFTSSKVDG